MNNIYGSTKEKNRTCEVLCDYVSYVHTRSRIEIEIAEGGEMAELNHRTGSCARSYVAARTHLRRLRFSSAIKSEARAGIDRISVLDIELYPVNLLLV